jgi:hypothetical protein
MALDAKDYRESYHWFRIADCYGLGAGNEQEGLRSKITQLEIEEEDRNAVEFVKTHPLYGDLEFTTCSTKATGVSDNKPAR